jgi:hypothetical protein
VTLCPSSLETYKRAASAGPAVAAATTMPSHRMRRGVRAPERQICANIEVAAVVLDAIVGLRLAIGELRGQPEVLRKRMMNAHSVLLVR